MKIHDTLWISGSIGRTFAAGSPPTEKRVLIVHLGGESGPIISGRGGEYSLEQLKKRMDRPFDYAEERDLHAAMLEALERRS